MNSPAPSRPKNTRTRAAQVRLLATTDLHGHLLPHDYTKDQPTQGGGLAGLARLINEERASAAAAGIPTVLLDNGDTFQGTPLASHLAKEAVGPQHPLVAGINLLRYDALGLGNHDLDHGLPYLKAVATALDMPILSSNLTGVDIAPLKQSLLLAVDLGPNAPAPLTLGLISVLPTQSAAWHSHHLGAASSVEEPETAAATTAQALRAAGADLIVVLAHMGVGLAGGANSDIEAAQALTRSGRIDALILGHTHRRLPSVDYAARPGIDIHTSTLNGVPAMMPGHAGSDLGVMDLHLEHDSAQGWKVSNHRCMLHPNGPNVLADPDIVALAAPLHAIIRTNLSEVIATTKHPLHSFFSVVSPTPTQHLTALVQHRLVRDALAGTEHADLPLLATAAALGAGGRDGVGNYVHIPRGDVLRRHLAGLNPFVNHAVGIAITGAGLRTWLEHSALLFNKLCQSAPEQMLVNPDIPAFQFDTIFGLNYCIDPCAPPLGRIHDLTYCGAPVPDDKEFILATNQFRVSGGSGYAKTPAAQIITSPASPVQMTMAEVLKASGPMPWDDTPPWRFAANRDVQAMILTHPDALECIQDISHLRPILKGTTPDGFIRLSVSL